MNDCQNFAADIAAAFQQIFDIGGWNAVLWVFIGWLMGGGFTLALELFERRRAA